jgi:DNA helicase IV
MKKFLYIFLFSLILLSTVWSKTDNKKPFLDISPNHWAYKAVVDLYNKGIIKGYYNEAIFKGEKKLSRYDMSVLLDRTIKYLQSSNKFSKIGLDDLKKLKKLLLEFSDEISKLELDNASLKKSITSINERLKNVERRQGEIEKTIKKVVKKEKERNNKLRPLDIILIIATGVLIGKVY